MLHRDVFGALADPTRRAILDRLRTGRRSVSEIAHYFPVSRPAISKHLRVLRRARLVIEWREGRNRIYDLNPSPLSKVDAWLAQYRSSIRENLKRLKTYVKTRG